jgi:hypothetical protein
MLDGMVIGMATSKITITLPDDQLEEVRALGRWKISERLGVCKACVENRAG